MGRTPSVAPGRTGSPVDAAAATIDRGVAACARHWLAGVNAVLTAWAGLAALAPVLVAFGHGAQASLIYALFRPLCHQRPDRSFYLLGEKLACCERCAAIYGGAALFGLAFAVLPALGPLAWSRFLLCCLPMAFDGTGQMLGLWESTPGLRASTGALFAVGAGWVVLPHLERAVREIGLRSSERHPGPATGCGRAWRVPLPTEG